MKNGGGGHRGRERALLQASRRLNATLERAGRLGAPFVALDSVTLLTGACGARGPLSGRVLTVCAVSLLMGTLALALACGQFAELTPCRVNSSKELHIQTMSWNRHPDERGSDGASEECMSEECSSELELREYEEIPLSTSRLRQRRGR